MGDGLLSVRRRTAESDARIAGLGAPPSARSRFWPAPDPATPVSPLAIDVVCGFSSRALDSERGALDGDSIGLVERAMGVLVDDRLGFGIVESGFEIAGWFCVCRRVADRATWVCVLNVGLGVCRFDAVGVRRADCRVV